MSEGTEINNVIDFAAYRMEREVQSLRTTGQHESAEALAEALDAYLLGLCTVAFIEGKTYLTPTEAFFAEGKEEKTV